MIVKKFSTTWALLAAELKEELGRTPTDAEIQVRADAYQVDTSTKPTNKLPKEIF